MSRAVKENKERIDKMLCKKCGNPVKIGNKFCIQCGAKTEQSPPEKRFEVSCRNCGTKYLAEFGVCPHCGTIYDGLTEPVSVPEAPEIPEDNTPRCLFCGKELREGARFCSHCGQEQVLDSAEDSVGSDVQSTNYVVPAPEEPPVTDADGETPSSHGKKKGIVIGIVSALLCFVLILVLCFSLKSPEDILTDHSWYGEIDVDCDYYDWSDVDGYFFSASCRKKIFYSNGEARNIYYEIGNGGVVGPFRSEVTKDNIPPHAKWGKTAGYSDKWEVLDDKTLKYDGEYYSWDKTKDTRCDCDDHYCKHRNTWYITRGNLRIGNRNYTSKKPDRLFIDD